MVALKALRFRVPPGTPEPLADLAGEALETVADVMRGKVYRGGFERLTAARTVREEICGKVADKHEHSGVVLHVIDPYAEPPAAGATPARTAPPPPATADENQAADGGATGGAS